MNTNFNREWIRLRKAYGATGSAWTRIIAAKEHKERKAEPRNFVLVYLRHLGIYEKKFWGVQPSKLKYRL